MIDSEDHLVLIGFLLKKLVGDIFLGLTPKVAESEELGKFKVSVNAAAGDLRVFTFSLSDTGDLQSVTIEFASPHVEPVTVSTYVPLEDLNVTLMKNLATFINITCLIAPACFLPISFKDGLLNMRAADSTYGHLFKTALKSGVNIDSSVHQFFNKLRLDVRVKGEYNVIPY